MNTRVSFVQLFLIASISIVFACEKGDLSNDLTAISKYSEIDQPIRYLALGDSYTIGESVASKEKYPEQLADSLVDRMISVSETNVIAVTGWTTGDLKNAIVQQNPDTTYDLVSLLIGVNNFYQGRTPEEYTNEFEELLQTAIKHANGRADRVFVVSIPDYGYTPFGQGNQAVISAGIDQFNAINLQITNQYGVKYFDITPASREGLIDPELVANDGLHPSGKQYSVWTEIMIEAVVDMLQGG